MNRTLLWIVIALFVVWFFHIHYNRGVPVKRS